MPKPPRIPGKEITERIKAQLARYDRNPFQDALADALTVAPSKTAWRKYAKNDPGKWATAVATLGKSSGFAEKSEKLSLNLDAKDMARELTARHGAEKAKLLLGAAGLPTSLVDDKVIEHDDVSVSG